ncbi:aminotransferase class IV family protein [Nocardiopsis rhodophaea]|uniref:Aminotransferase class IV family protein n=1 Tax=Nocardiopsis rhodophaea TaxID=280238 RepID=A0ABP5F5N3_9ACTN
MGYLNGAPVDVTALKALAFSNFGHFTTMRVTEGRIRGLSLHLDRLVRDCRAVFDTDLDRERILELIRQGVRERSGVFITRVTVFDPQLDIGHPDISHPQILVTHRSAPTMHLPPLHVQTVAYQREMPEIKHVGLFGQLAARRAVQRRGFDDALFTDPSSGAISEGVTWNIGFVDERDRVVWPKAAMLPGVTMRLLHDVYDSLAEPMVFDDLRHVRAAFATNSSVGVRPIRAVGDVELEVDHPVLTELRQRYETVPDDPI